MQTERFLRANAANSMINRRFLCPNAANSMQNKKVQRQNAANSMQHGRFSSKMLQITRKMKGSSSKMLQIACSMEGKWQDRCRGRKPEQIRKKITRAGEKIPRRDSAPVFGTLIQIIYFFEARSIQIHA